MNLQDIISGAMNYQQEPERPRLPIAEERQLLLASRAALLRRETFTPGQFIRIKPDMHFGLFEDGNNIFLFDRMLDQPIESPAEAAAFSMCFDFDCVVYYITSNETATCRILPSVWFEAAE
ncbi:MAG: hypothetical protein HC888_01620 [Candidatus Competibacteraceae bacterium]|nr:hypothetical protein [Candidatus Competibacteraceae bacterium]